MSLLLLFPSSGPVSQAGSYSYLNWWAIGLGGISAASAVPVLDEGMLLGGFQSLTGGL